MSRKCPVLVPVSLFSDQNQHFPDVDSAQIIAKELPSCPGAPQRRGGGQTRACTYAQKSHISLFFWANGLVWPCSGWSGSVSVLARNTSSPLFQRTGGLPISETHKKNQFASEPEGLQLDWPWITEWDYAGIFVLAIQIQNKDQFWTSHQKNQVFYFFRKVEKWARRDKNDVFSDFSKNPIVFR